MALITIPMMHFLCFLNKIFNLILISSKLNTKIKISVVAFL